VLSKNRCIRRFGLLIIERGYYDSKNKLILTALRDYSNDFENCSGNANNIEFD
jgi:hypothetical protein